MKFSTGFFDGLFGKKTTLRVPQDDGTTREVPVTEAWLKKTQAEGKISMSEVPSSTVPFYVIGADGSETRQLEVGADIPETQYKILADPKTGALFGLTVYEKGVSSTNVIPKHLWEQAKAQFGETDSVGEQFVQRTKDRFRDL